MQVKSQSARFNALCLTATLLISFNVSAAQEATQGTAPPQQAPTGGVRIDPSAGPLAPGEPQATPTQQAPLPEAPQPVPQPAPQAQQRPAPQPTPQEPLGTAAAEQIKTAGGGASRPAGNAIAPEKQHQYRSMLIKLGAVAAAGIAVGTVYGLSRATPSTPPHASTGAAGK